LIYETGFRDTAAYLIAGFRDSAEVLRQRKVLQDDVERHRMNQVNG
jgi:hypothetical protein